MKSLAERAEEAKSTYRLEVTPEEYSMIKRILTPADVPPELSGLIGYPFGIQVKVIYLDVG